MTYERSRRRAWWVVGGHIMQDVRTRQAFGKTSDVAESKSEGMETQITTPIPVPAGISLLID